MYCIGTCVCLCNNAVNMQRRWQVWRDSHAQITTGVNNRTRSIVSQKFSFALINKCQNSPDSGLTYTYDACRRPIGRLYKPRKSNTGSIPLQGAFAVERAFDFEETEEEVVGIDDFCDDYLYDCEWLQHYTCSIGLGMQTWAMFS